MVAVSLKKKKKNNDSSENLKEKNQKQVVKSYNFEVATNAEDNTLKEVGEELKKLIDKNIDTITTSTKESL